MNILNVFFWSLKVSIREVIYIKERNLEANASRKRYCSSPDDQKELEVRKIT